MSGGPETFPGGERYLVTLRTRLPSGALQIEILLPDSTRRRFTTPEGATDDEVEAAIARALRQGDRIVKGRRVGSYE